MVQPAFMQRCIDLAALGAGFVAPNPMVGAVLVHRGRIIGEGYHRHYGQPHAEVNCIRDAEARFGKDGIGGTPMHEVMRQCTLYVSLEPCAHFGKTPPCADLIIRHGIAHVVVGCRDPFALVNGKGIEKLRAAGIPVTAGVLERECQHLNRRFFHFHARKQPYTILKWAQGADGHIAGANRAKVQISNPVTNRLVHRWRSHEAAILVGTNTALADDPRLDTRLWSGKNPVRAVLDMKLRLPGSLRLFDHSVPTLIFNGDLQERRASVTYYPIDPLQPAVPQMLHAFHQLSLLSVIVEGGAVLLQSFIDSGMWNEARVITGNLQVLPGGLPAPVLPAAATMYGQCQLMQDTVRYYRNESLQPLH